MAIPMLLPFAASAIGGISSAISGNREQKKANQLAEKQRQFEEQRWNEGGQFRNAGAQMLNRQIDPAAMTQLFADPGNPYASTTQFQPLWKASEMQAAPQANPQQQQANDLRVVAAGVRNPRIQRMMNDAAQKMTAASAPQDRAQLEAFSQTMVPSGGRR
ncbi:hypothetical protein [Gemmatimonas aurantiaca]|nr:hypothetical protein [Gemmatimonas aurantiaca]